MEELEPPGPGTYERQMKQEMGGGGSWDPQELDSARQLDAENKGTFENPMKMDDSGVALFQEI